MRHNIGWTVAVLLLVSACDDTPGEPKGQYALSQRDANARLAANDFTEFRTDRQCGILIHVRPSAHARGSMTWQVWSGGVSQLSFTATLTPVDDHHTKVDITVSPKLGGHEPYDGTQFYYRPAVKQPVRPAIEEQVAAALEARPYDVERLPAAAKDSVCLVQRGGLEEGMPFDVNDRPGADSR